MKPDFHGILALPSAKPYAGLQPSTSVRRGQAILEAMSWTQGLEGHRFYTELYSNGRWSVRLGKPGKEAAPGYKPHKAHDMTPTVFFDGAPLLKYLPTFEEVFGHLQHLSRAAIDSEKALALEFMASLFVRSAYMLDHIDISEQDSLPAWRWRPATEVLDEIGSAFGQTNVGPIVELPSGEAAALPFDVYLQHIEALALNEDVKYQAYEQRFLEKRTATGTKGRQGTLLTCANVIGVLCDKVQFSVLLGLASRQRGVAPISLKNAISAFPILKPLE